MENGIFESSIRTSGDLAAIFECDEEGGYFYLFDLTKEKGRQARAVIVVSEHGVDLQGSDVSVRWNTSEEIAGLCIHGDLWAAFDQHGRRYGGSYGAQNAPSIPPEVIRRFKSGLITAY
jgi:hypothetical protein